MTVVNKRSRANSQEKTRNAVLATLKLSDQPLVINEIHALLAMRGVSLHVTYVSEILKQLIQAGKISQRNETPAERVIRHGRHEPRGAHFQAVYFWGKPGKVPARTEASHIRTTGRMVKKTRRPAKASRVQTGTKITARENLSLMARVAELEAQIAEMRKIIG